MATATRALPRLRTRPVDPSTARVVRAQMAATGTPGVAVGILYQGRALASGFGITSIQAPDPVNEETLFQIGSTTKTYTATAIMRLVEGKEVDLDAPVRRYLRDLQLADPTTTRRVTIRHLLTHTGGWAGDFFHEDRERGKEALAGAVVGLAKAPQLTPLGEVWHYNNAGFYIAGRVLEKVMKKSFEDAIRELLLEPLGMTRSFFFAEEAIGYRIAGSHATKTFKSKKQIVLHPWELPRYVGPAGGIIADAVDQLRWAWFHMGDGRAPDGKRLLRKTTLREMQRPHAPTGGSLAQFVGLSWFLEDVGGVRVVSHGGTTNGHLSAFVMVPEREFAITVLTNSSRGIQVHRALVQHALRHYLGVEREQPKLAARDGIDLQTFAGRYVEPYKKFAVDIRPMGARLHAAYISLDPDGDDPGLPPFRLGLIDADHAVIQGGRLDGYRADFLRDEKGRVRWLRIGGRLLRRRRLS